jgi:hypothetical protein
VKKVKHIGLFFLVALFLLTSSGILIYQIDCSCLGQPEVSLYVTPETCSDKNIHEETHSCCVSDKEEAQKQDCSSCTNHDEDCGCTAPDVQYVRLIDQITEEEIQYIKVNEINVLSPILIFNEINNNVENENFKESDYIDPPPIVLTSFEYLIKINKLKIPEIA